MSSRGERRSGQPDPDPPDMTVDELARAAGTTTRNVRALQTRGVLTAPRIEGRTARYSTVQRDELGAVRRLQARGHSVAGIADLLCAWRGGRTLEDVIGLPARTHGPVAAGAASTAAAHDLPDERVETDGDGDRFDRLLPWERTPPSSRPPLLLVPGPFADVLAS